MKIDTTKVQPGQTIIYKNTTNQALKYTLDYGEYGKVVYDLIIGASLEITVGSKAPVIITGDSETDSVIKVVE